MLAVGTQVEIRKGQETHDLYWLDSMDKFVGKVGTVIGFDEVGYTVAVDGEELDVVFDEQWLIPQNNGWAEIARDCLEYLVATKDVFKDEDGVHYWTSTGIKVGGE